jgi:SAM-dependent methyltransferase
VAGALTERDFVAKLERAGFGAIEVLQRDPTSIDDCELYPLFDDELLALMRRLIRPEMGTSNVEFVEAEAEHLPFPSESFDVVVSNGVIDLIPDKDAVFGELFRVLVPGGRLQIADVTIQNPVSEDGRRKIDLWTG